MHGFGLIGVHLNRLFHNIEYYRGKQGLETNSLCLATVNLTMSDTKLKPFESRKHEPFNLALSQSSQQLSTS